MLFIYFVAILATTIAFIAVIFVRS